MDGSHEMDDAGAKKARLGENLGLAVQTTLTSACLYGLLHQTLHRSGLVRGTTDPAKVCSLTNAILSASLGLSTIASDACARDVVHAYPGQAHGGLGFFSGYALYDLCVLSIRRQWPTHEAALWTHHVLALLGSLAAMSVRRLTFLPAAALTSEASLLSVLWLQRVRERGGTQTAMGRASLIRLVSTLVFRTFLIPLCTVKAYRSLKRQVQRERAASDSRLECAIDGGAGNGVPRAGGGDEVTMVNVWSRLRKEVPSWALLGTACNLSVFSALNLLWTLQMIRSKTWSSNRIRS